MQRISCCRFAEFRVQSSVRGSTVKETVKQKSKKFALRIVNLYRYLTGTHNEFVLPKQILRSGTSIGANIAEAVCGISGRDFLAKIYIALKEAEETLYWLDLLKDADFITEKMYKSLFRDCHDIAKMLNKTTKTMQEKLDNCTLHSEL